MIVSCLLLVWCWYLLWIVGYLVGEFVMTRLVVLLLIMSFCCLRFGLVIVVMAWLVSCCFGFMVNY